MIRKIFPSVLAAFQHVCERIPHNIAVEDGLETLTYRALDRRSSRLAKHLQRMGARPSQTIPILTTSCLHMVVGILAILKLGATYIPIDRDQWPRQRVDDVLQRTSAGLIVYTGESMDIPDTVMVKVEDVNDDDLMEEDELEDGKDMVSLPEVATIIFTSGTTGKPKGVEIRHESLANFVATRHFNYDVNPEDRVLLVLSVAFDACMGTLFNTICNGGTVVLANRSTLQKQSRRCSVLVMTPSILEALEPPRSRHDYPRLDRIVLGGETASRKLLTTWSILERPTWIAYGPTEATCATLTGLVQTKPETGEFRPTILGTVIDGARVAIIDANGEEIEPLDEEGELVISGTGLARGYFRDEHRTDERFVFHNGVRTYKTGDFAKWSVDLDGKKVIDFCGRRDRTVKIRGFLVNLEVDVDAAMLALEPSISAVHSVMVGGRLYTMVSPVPRDVTELKSRWRASVPPYLVPDHVVGLESLPITPNGKVDTRKLVDIVKTMVSDTQQQVEDTTNLKSVMLSGMARILDIPIAAIDVDQSLVSQGLHSLAAVMLCSHCRRQGFSVPIEAMLTAPTIDRLLQVYRNKSSTRTQESRPSRGASEAPLTRLQKMLIYDSMQQKAINMVQHIIVYQTKDVPHMRSAWHSVVAAEPIFKTVLDPDSQTQRITDKASFRWAEHHVDSRDDVERRSNEAAAAAGLGACFTVLHNRGRLLPCNESTIIFSIHHALVDGFSASLILNKVAAASKGISFDPSPPFTVAVERLQQHAAQTCTEADAFWTQQDREWGEAAGEMLLPKPMTMVPDRHAEYSVQTGLSVATLTKCAQAGGTTVAALHYAAWALVLASYTNAEKVVFGAVVSARTLGFEGAESIVGPLISTQPLRIAVHRRDSCGALLQQTYEGLRSLSRLQASGRKGEPLHYCSAVATQYDAPSLAATAMAPLRPAVVRESPALPLTVLVEGDGRVRFLYRCNRFGADHIRDMAAMYRNVLHALTQPGRSVHQCLRRRLDAVTSQRLLAWGNHKSPTARVRATGPTVTSRIEAAARVNASRVAVRKGDAELTYAELMVRALRVAAAAATTGMRPGEVVGVVADRSINWIVGVCAVLLAGGVYAPLDKAHTAAYRAELLASSGATLLLCTTSEQLEEPRPDGLAALAVDQLLAARPAPVLHVPVPEPSVRDAAFVCFTSGSTGKPKGVVCTHGAVTAFHADVAVRLHSAPGVRIAQFLSPGFDGCVHEVFASLCYGATLVLRSDVQDPFSHLGGVDVAMMTPSVAAGLESADYPNLKCVYFAGEPVPQSTLDQWAVGRSLYNLYGPTEGTIGACQQKLQAGVPVNVGPPVPSTRLYILDDALELSPPGVAGNVFLAGVQVSRGYINKELAEQNARDFQADPFSASPAGGRGEGEGEVERMYRTGDVGFWDAARNVHLCGRKDRQIKMRGFRVNLDDVGAIATREMAEVRKAIATEHKGKLVLWIEPEDVDTQALAQRLRAVLPHHALPKHIVAQARLPMSKNGKVDTKALVLHQAQAPVHEPTQSHSLTQFEALVAQEWRQLLGMDASSEITSKDNFAALGGHSELQLRLAARLRKVCNTPLAFKDIIQARTLADMAAVVQARIHRWNAQSKHANGPVASPLGTQALSPAELEWWHRYQASHSQSAFNVPWVAVLQPRIVDPLRLAYAINTTLARHRILRSRFVSTADGGVKRVIADEPIHVQTVHSVDIAEFINRPFDLTKDVLTRVAMSTSTLAVSISHIICDLTGLHTLLAEAATLYNGGSVAPTVREYFDSTAWSEPLERETALFWHSNLQGLQLRREPDDATWKKSYEGTSLLVPVPHELCRGIVAQTTASALTLHQFGLAATGTVLHALCGRRDVMLGSPYMNRASVDDQRVVGLFLQALPVRVKADETMTSLEVLRAVQSASQNSLAHPTHWPRLLETLGLPFPSYRQQLFDCVVTFHDDRTTRESVFPVKGARPLHVWTEGAKFGLLFEWHIFAHRLSIRLEYDSNRVPEMLVGIIQKLLLHAIERLLAPTYQYGQLLSELNALFEQQCMSGGTSVDEMRTIAVQHLQGV